MDNVLEVDRVLQYVRQVARQSGFATDAALTQQILLFSEAFYGYRFTAKDFTAIWSAADQTIKMHDRDGRTLGVFSVAKDDDSSSAQPLALPALQRRAA